MKCAATLTTCGIKRALALPILTLALVLSQAACSNAGHKTAAGPTPTAHAPSELLFAVLEAVGLGSSSGSGPGVAEAHDTIAIVEADGTVRAKATFKPRHVPFVGNADPLLQPEARIAAGAVFYIDGDGVVRRLDASGGVTEVAKFPITQSQQEVSFAVSPDGQHLVANVLTLPPPGPSGPEQGFQPGVPFHLELEAADAGGSTRTLSEVDVGQGVSPLNLVLVVGWDSSGPLVTALDVGTQQGSLGRGVGRQLARLDQSGHVSEPLLQQDCFIWERSPSGTTLCTDGNDRNITERSASGQVLWAFPPADQQYLYVTMSPDGSHIACTLWYMGGDQVRSRDGSVVDLPDKLLSEGWLDDDTIIGVKGDYPAPTGDLATVHLSSPSQLTDLGFKGLFVGLIR